MKNAILIAILVLLPPILNADTYKWVNDEGVVTYSETPPPGRPAERIKLHGSKSPGSGQSSQTRLNQLRQKLADSKEDRDLAKQKRQAEKEELDLKRQNCNAARSNLRSLESLGSRLYQINGEYRRLTEQERQDLMQQEREHIKANCKK